MIAGKRIVLRLFRAHIDGRKEPSTCAESDARPHASKTGPVAFMPVSDRFRTGLEDACEKRVFFRTCVWPLAAYVLCV